MRDKVDRVLHNFVLTVICCVIVIFLVGCEPVLEIENTEIPNSQNVSETTTNEITKSDDTVYHVDLTKISPMILENVSEDVIWLAMLTAKNFSELESIASKVMDKRELRKFMR